MFGDTANSGTVLGENPIRANVTGQPVFPSGTQTATAWFNTAAFAAPAAFTFGNAGRNSVYGPGMQTLDFAVVRNFALTEATAVPIPSRVFQRAQPYQLGHAGPLREHAAVRHDYGSRDPGTGNSAERETVILENHPSATSTFQAEYDPGMTLCSRVA